MFFIRSACAVLAICLFPINVLAQTLDPEVRTAIAEFADSICGVYNLEGSETAEELEGKARASVDGFLEKLVDLGVEGSATFSEEKYTNVFRKDIAQELKDIRTCRIEIWRDLKDTLIVVKRQETQRIVPEFNDDFRRNDTLPVSRAFVARATPSFNCAKASTTGEKVLCVHYGAAETDVALSNAYRQLRAGLNATDKQSLTTTQRRWLQYRENTCNIGIEFQRLSDAQIEQIGNCIANITVQRTTQLRNAF